MRSTVRRTLAIARPQCFRTSATAVPGIMAGVRLGIGRAVVGMVSAELLIVSVGIGLVIMQYTGALETAKLYAAIATVIAMGVLVSYFGQWLDRTISQRHGRRGAFEI